MADEKAWAEYWDGSQGDDAIGGAQRHKLAAIWRTRLDDGYEFAGTPVVVDIAAGAGVALKAAAGAFNRASSAILLAIDVAPSALLSAMHMDPRIAAAAADVAHLPLRDQCADLVISQFGVEYAGLAAFAEAARIVVPRGRFCSISHYAGGAIDLECAENERLLNLLAETALFAKARATLEASFNRRSRRDPQPIDREIDAAFAAACATADRRIRTAPASAARTTLERFTADLIRLSARRFAYEPSDALGWLGGMEASLDAYRRRMHSMRAAALDSAKISAIAGRFEAAGLTDFRAEPLRLDEDRPPAAWVIEAYLPPKP